MSVCRICLEEDAGAAGYHPDCVRRLFGQPVMPRLIEDRDSLQRHGVEMVTIGRASISGVQPKVLVRLAAGGEQLEVVGKGGLYILKPQTPSFAALPENEHLTMRMAEVCGLDVPVCGLLNIGDGSEAYVVRRFDRGDGEPPAKYHQEDLCALAELPSDKKYDGSAELCARLLRKYTDAPETQLRRLFHQLLFGFWTGNGDIHLKNLSVTTRERVTALTPAYDLVSTRLVIPGDEGMALTINGKRHRLRRADWLKFAAYCAIEPDEAGAQIDRLLGHAEALRGLIRRSFLPAAQQDLYAQILDTRAAALA